MQLTIPKGHELFFSIIYKKSIAYQLVPIEDIGKVFDRLPEGAKVKILVESFEKLRWSYYKYWPEEKEVKLHRYHYPGTKEYIYTNSEYQVCKKAFDFDRLSGRLAGRPKYLTNVATSCKILGYDVKMKNRDLIVNGIPLNASFVKDFNNELKSYILYRNLFPYDFMVMDKLIEDKILTTLLINKHFKVDDLVKDGVIKIPYRLNKLFYFLFGKIYKLESYVVNGTKKEEYGLKMDVKLKALQHRRRTVVRGVGYELCAYEGKPYLFVSGIPIMYSRYHKSNQPTMKRKNGRK